MNADRIEWYANQLRGIPVADIPRTVRRILFEATNEVRRAERERVISKLLNLGALGDGDFILSIQAME